MVEARDRLIIQDCGQHVACHAKACRVSGSPKMAAGGAEVDRVVTASEFERAVSSEIREERGAMPRLEEAQRGPSRVTTAS